MTTLLITIKSEHEWGHNLTDEHLKKIRERFPELNVVIAKDEANEEEAASADIFAGFPIRIPEVKAGMQVRWIHSFSAGVDKVLTPEVKASDEIIVSNSSGVHAVPISEHIIGMLISYNRNFPRLIKNQADARWEKDVEVAELADSTVVIYGLGEIGKATAKLLKAFGCTVYGVVRTMREAPECVDGLYTSETVPEVLPTADYIICALPGGPQTEGLFDTALFAQMKPTAVLVNVGRGSTVNQDDLIVALQEGTIGGALLDVTTPEPLSVDSPLWLMPNVIITPHISGLSQKAMDRIIDRLCLNIDAFLKGEPLPNQVDKELGY